MVIIKLFVCFLILPFRQATDSHSKDTKTADSGFRFVPVVNNNYINERINFEATNYMYGDPYIKLNLLLDVVKREWRTFQFCTFYLLAIDGTVFIHL